MKYAQYFILVFSVLAMNCAHTNWNLDEKSGRPMLSGRQPRTAFNDTSYSWWWNSEYDMYAPDSTVLRDCAPLLQNVKTTIVMGTWCSDSKREVPRFFKIADLLHYDTSNVAIICVNRKKESPVQEDIAGLKIEKVPTFIFKRKGREIGRIVESPAATLEKDLRLLLEIK
jgi:thiol-disulfide isomerase/thioredoxin